MTEGNAVNTAPVDPADPSWRFRLYIAGTTPAGDAARTNLTDICDHCVPAKCLIEVVDLIVDSARAEADGVFAVPTLIRLFPVPTKRVIGDLSDRARVLETFDIPAATARPFVSQPGQAQ